MTAPRGFRGLTAQALGDDLVERLREAGYSVPSAFITALPRSDFSTGLCGQDRAALRHHRDGDVIDLGDRALEVLHLPGHSPGSIALWEESTGTLFSGDAIYDGPLLYDLPGASVADYIRTLRRLLTLEVETVHAGHDPSFGRERLREIARVLLGALGVKGHRLAAKRSISTSAPPASPVTPMQVRAGRRPDVNQRA